MWETHEELKEQFAVQIDRLEIRKDILEEELELLRSEFIKEFNTDFDWLVLLNCLTCLAVTLLVLESVLR